MAKKVQEIQAKLTGDNSDLVQALNDAGKKIKKTAQDAEKQASAVGGKMNDALAGVGTWALDKTIEKVGQAVEYVKEQINAMADVGKGAQAAGLDPVLFQQLTKTAEASGYSFEEARAQFEAFEDVLIAARSGNRKAILQLEAIGTSVAKLQGLSPWDAFTRAIPEAENLQEHLDKIFGEKAAGSEGFRRFLNTAKNASYSVFDEKAIANAMKYREAVEKLNSTIVGFINDTGLITWLTAQIEGLQALINPPSERDDARSPTEDGKLLNRKADLNAALEYAGNDGLDAELKQRRTRIKRIQSETQSRVELDSQGRTHFIPGRSLTDAEQAELEQLQTDVRRMELAQSMTAEEMRAEIKSIDERRKKAIAERKKAKEAAKAQERSPDDAVRELHQLEQEEEAAATKQAAEEATKLRKMNPLERLNYQRQKAIDALMAKSPELTKNDAAATVYREEAKAFSAGKYPERWTEAGITTRDPMDVAAQRLLKAAESISKDGLYVRKRN